MDEQLVSDIAGKPDFRLIVAGSREFFNYDDVAKVIDKMIVNKKQTHNIVIVSGGAQGPDTLGRAYAIRNGYRVELYKADWDGIGKSAGYRRNEQMRDASDALLAFWDGKSKGTRHMIESMLAVEKPVRIAEVDTVYQCVNRMMNYEPEQ